MNQAYAFTFTLGDFGYLAIGTTPLLLPGKNARDRERKTIEAQMEDVPEESLNIRPIFCDDVPGNDSRKFNKHWYPNTRVIKFTKHKQPPDRYYYEYDANDWDTLGNLLTKSNFNVDNMQKCSCGKCDKYALSVYPRRSRYTCINTDINTDGDKCDFKCLPGCIDAYLRNNPMVSRDIDSPDWRCHLCPIKYKKQHIPKQLKRNVWSCFAGNNKKMKCPMDCGRSITMEKHHCGHIKAEKKGGELKMDNLKPVCAKCNQMMQQNHMYEWKESMKKRGLL